ncbi:Adenosine deaminase domain-containing protein 1 [Heterocephalus glaber]|uniref:Adenosine deaminase domain-containing protein 1 n=1 Tax=Heterocephalus glaber TaxID=10181 RepID=G5AKD7_HETGA|nr:Adenosine deaminase domain-containing protein 1 [Heterocephalus glaber]
MVAAGGSQRAWGLRLGLALAGTRVPAAPSPGHGGKGVLSEKTGSSDWFQGSRGPSFAQTQTLKKNLPIQPVVQMETPPARRSSESGSLSAMASKVTRVTGNFPEPLLSKSLSSTSNPALPPKEISKKFIMKYKRGEINPVSALHQFAQMQRVQLDLKETVTTGKLVGDSGLSLEEENADRNANGQGQSQEFSAGNRAPLALFGIVKSHVSSCLLLLFTGPPPISAEPVVSPEPAYVSKVHYDGRHAQYSKISQTVKEIFNQLISSHSEYLKCTNSLAAFIVERAGHHEVVAVGTGEYNCSQCIQPHGRVLHDTQGVVTARRSLLRYFYRQLLLFYSKNPIMMEKSIFCTEPASDLLTLKEDTNIYLYMNQLPKGSAQIKSQLSLNPNSVSAFEAGEELSLHVAVEAKFIFLFTVPPALLINSPFKSGVSMASRLCKAAMLSRFKLLAKEAKRDYFFKPSTYYAAKNMSGSYQEAKTLLKSYLQQHGYGSWIVKSPDIEQFNM